MSHYCVLKVISQNVQRHTSRETLNFRSACSRLALELYTKFTQYPLPAQLCPNSCTDTLKPLLSDRHHVLSGLLLQQFLSTKIRAEQLPLVVRFSFSSRYYIPENIFSAVFMVYQRRFQITTSRSTFNIEHWEDAVYIQSCVQCSTPLLCMNSHSHIEQLLLAEVRNLLVHHVL